MKKAILALLFIAGTVFSANAQAPVRTPEQRAMHMTRALEKQLNLSVRQARRIDRIYLSQALQIDSLHNNPSPNRRADARQRQRIKRTTKQEVMDLLTNKQQQKFIEYQRMVRQRHSNKKAGGADPNNGDNGGQG